MFFSSVLYQNIILSLTLLAAIYIGVRQNQINKNTNDSYLRPIILRDGFIPAWSDVKDGGIGISGEIKPFLFNIQRNIATDIKGYIVLDGKKYDLLFGIGVLNQASNQVSSNSIGQKTMGWIKKEGFLLAKYDMGSFIEINLSNQIYITYKDIAGNSYYSKEDLNYLQTSNKLEITLWKRCMMS